MLYVVHWKTSLNEVVDACFHVFYVVLLGSSTRL